MFKFVADHKNKTVVFQVSKNSFYVKGAIRKAFHAMGKDLKDYARKEILDKTKKTGRIYYYYKNGKRYRHQASAPGQFPANLTGKLRKSIGFTVIGSSQLDFGASAPYAKFLEDGTQRKFFKRLGNGRYSEGMSAGMLARPFLKMSIENNKARSIEYLEREVKLALNRAASHGFNKVINKSLK